MEADSKRGGLGVRPPTCFVVRREERGLLCVSTDGAADRIDLLWLTVLVRVLVTPI